VYDRVTRGTGGRYGCAGAGSGHRDASNLPAWQACTGLLPVRSFQLMNGPLALPTLLSHALVAFTIEFDNEAERQMQHRTTRRGATAGSLHAPWLVSLAMWFNCMQFIGDEAVAVRELERRARTKTNLAGIERWGYIVIEPDPPDRRPKPPRSAWVVRATAAGRAAQEVWRPLFGVIEKRWQERFGTDEIERLQEALWAVAGQLEFERPDCLPILGYGLFSKGRDFERREAGSASRLPLAALLARVLLRFALEFESQGEVSLAISANIVRVLNEKGVRVRDLPILSGVSKEAIAVSLSFSQQARLRGDRGGQIRQPDKGCASYPEGSSSSTTHTGSCWARSKSAGRRALEMTRSAHFGSRWSGWSASPQRSDRLCSAAWSPTLRDGERRCAAPTHCRTFPWCCIAADSRMAVDPRTAARRL
jgi:hypothetical protein